MEDPEDFPAVVPLREYVDAQLSEVRRAATFAGQSPYSTGIPLREHMEAVLDEQRRTLLVAETEREKTAQALRASFDRIIADSYSRLCEQIAANKDYIEAILTEQRRGLMVAEQEREKSAQALAISLAGRIDSGDHTLREHIEQQVAQIRAALESADALAMERIAALAERLAGVRRELEIVQNESEKAIQKAEVANERRFDSVNEWRGQSADRERSQQEQTTKLTPTFLPRETFESTVIGWTQWQADVNRRLSETVGRHESERRHETRAQPWALWAAGAILTLVITIVIIAASVLTSI